MRPPLALRTNIADYPVTRALKDGTVTSSLVELAFCGPRTAHDGFKAMLREGAFDVGEMAIATLLQAKAFGKPYVMIPAATAGRQQHGSIVYNTAAGPLAPRDIEGRKVGVRAYAQTTGLWVRGLLQHEYGVDLDQVTWMTTEDAHVAEVRDPPNCVRLPADASLVQMLLDGEIAAAILGPGIPADPRIAPLIPTPDEAARQWHAREGVVPINHMVIVHQDISRQRPDIVREIYRMLAQSRQHAPDAAAKLPPLGLEANRKALAMAIDWAFEQKLIDRRMTVDSLFDETTAHLD